VTLVRSYGQWERVSKGNEKDHSYFGAEIALTLAARCGTQGKNEIHGN
jgi:UTP:GlnB (protein PII) uridylyltransferase